jgi:hypothetical protein
MIVDGVDGVVVAGVVVGDGVGVVVLLWFLLLFLLLSNVFEVAASLSNESARRPFGLSRLAGTQIFIIDKNTPTGDVLNFYARRNLMFTERGVYAETFNLCSGVYVSAFVGLCLLNAPIPVKLILLS